MRMRSLLLPPARSWLLAALCCCSAESKQQPKPTVDDFLVQGLDEIDPVFGTFQGQMHAGLISITSDINADDGRLMFWLFEPEAPQVDDTLLV